MNILHISLDETKKMSNEEAAEIKTYLILKYGSLDKAFIVWMTNEYDTFSLEEHEVILAHEQAKYPNLKLKHNRS